MPKKLSQRKKNRIRKAAKELYADVSNGDIEIDPAAPVLTSGEFGYWCQAWVYVHKDDV